MLGTHLVTRSFGFRAALWIYSWKHLAQAFQKRGTCQQVPAPQFTPVSSLTQPFSCAGKWRHQFGGNDIGVALPSDPRVLCSLCEGLALLPPLQLVSGDRNGMEWGAMG